MKESIRCCISCILPCGVLDVIRIVHASGRVEEIGGRASVLAAEIMRTYPEHVLRMPPPSSSSDAGECGPARGAVVLPPNAELQRGKIYFLMPVVPAETKKTKPSPRRNKKKGGGHHLVAAAAEEEEQRRLLVSDRYLSEILSEKASTQRERRRGRVAVWRPHLESIDEIDKD